MTKSSTERSDVSKSPLFNKMHVLQYQHSIQSKYYVRKLWGGGLSKFMLTIDKASIGGESKILESIVI